MKKVAQNYSFPEEKLFSSQNRWATAP